MEVEDQDQTKLSPSIKMFNSDDDDWDPEIATEPSDFSGSVVPENVTRVIFFETADSVDEWIPWGEWGDDADVAVQFASDPAQARDIQIGENFAIRPSKERIEEDDGRNATTTEHTTGRLSDEPENGEIKKRRYMKRDGGTRRHGRPPDLTLGGPFGHSESWNMGVYPGRGPALISRADMIILPPTTPPPSRTPPPATTTLCPPRADEGVAGPVDVLKGLPRNLFSALSGLSAAGNASPPTANSGIPKSSELSVTNPANLSP